MQSKVAEVQTADANAARSGEACGRNRRRVQWREKCRLSQLRATLALVFAVFSPDTSPMTVEQLPQATDQDNPIPLGSQLNVDTEWCLDSMLNNFQDVCQFMELQDLEPVSPV